MPQSNPSYLVIGDTEYVTTIEAAERLGDDITPDMIRDWTKRGLLKTVGRYGGRSNIYRLIDVALVERSTRAERRGRTRRAGQLQKIAPVGHNLPAETQEDTAQIQDIEQTCGLIKADGRPCPKVSLPDAPFRICRDHLREAHIHWSSHVIELSGYTETQVQARHDEYQRVFEAKKSLRASSPFVYYVRFGDRIKIGYSADVRGRLANLPYDELLALEPGPIDLERMRHRQFVAYKIKGEWFQPHPELLSHVAMLVRHFGPAQVQLEDLY